MSAILPGYSEEGRAFLQERIALWSKTAFGVSLFFLIGGNTLGVLTDPGDFVFPANLPNFWHLVGACVSLSAWLVARKVARLGQRTLMVIDIAATLLSLSAYAVMAVSLTTQDLSHGLALAVARMDLFMMLITMLTLTLRAVIVPSTARYTILVSAAGAIPVETMSYWVLSHYTVGNPPVTPAMGLANSGLWSIAAVLVAAIISRVIYGLQAQVKAAQRLGQYVLGERIGQGAMGTVYRASHALLRRPTAIKLLPPDRTGAESLSRFEREVQLTSRLTHPNTVAIFDYGHTPEGIFYYAMEYLDGLDHEQLVERYGPQPASRVIHLLAQVCGSLAEAHGLGIVHRDVKPANIILCERGGVADVAKVVDFGLVKELEVPKDARVTHADAILGTPLYLAPEVIRDPDSVDARADLYALGAVMYFLLTGAPIFDEGTVVEICAKHLHEPPIPPSSRTAVPTDLESIVLRCLEKKPAARPETALALRDALLACDIPAWTESEARAWWSVHHDSPSKRSTAPPGPSALTIDLQQRDAQISR